MNDIPDQRAVFQGQPGGPQDLFFAQSDTVPRPTFIRGEGVWLYDDAGRGFMDMSSGPVTANIGHGDKDIAAAMAEQAGRLAFVSARQGRHQANMDLSKRVAELAGPGFERVLFASGGSEAVEFAIKLLRQRALANEQPERYHVITCMPSYHGSTIGALGLSGDPANQLFLNGFGHDHPKVPAPLSYRLPDNHTVETHALACAQALDEKIQSLGPETVLAFLVEPVGGLASGAVEPPESYLRSVREICDRHGVALVFDEVLCGAGRTGRFLASHHYDGIRPDLTVLAKGLSAGYAPLGAVLAPADMVDRLSERLGFGYTHTYSAHPVSAAAALAVLDRFEREDLAGRAERVGAYLRQKLETLAQRSAIIGDVRGKGLLFGIELVADKTTKATISCTPGPTDTIRRRGLEQGLLIYARRTAGSRYGDWIMATPPLIITEAECDELVEKLATTLAAAEADFRAAGAIA
ncbi:MAG: aminotransferase class III-fold pyridoxal phosphate-dependent enzyme [Alphaproteobacteria bacterium]|jgi:adenosylmethionine-8-amino-7-oxononanoate aminotransferase|nr:aminotransferase class III-fold pyridoxal phosphate-dependent enzyme [Alphaproteobacteria bacterium]MDP6256903.1 aminotransferase class III-fold pyridoxal phosphate-dependent enzyme [Alphaproteobacteria bacterium]MDP7056657.1 aminotransferase class III-fold pyridoxal phosphate-dependent enzyme [Alphaproteobacteria bacterium]MDP7230374.1 aminotransferase class III-fold pyridoxal phosphate-dependent enzyme [Alphaproteobacteria bacterium]MDP7460450.1 aminotransferase class III-fold pyridoxal ph|tara:strand:- start:356 stop:1753 length:1398 start_codon:yes stop_codon:yes gene_type:complete